MKKKFVIMLLFLTVLSFTACSGIKSKRSFYSPDELDTGQSVLVSIDCSDILDNIENLDEGLGKYVPEYGLVIPDGKYDFEDGDTVYDVLVKVARKNKIQFEAKGLFGNREIEGINYIYNSSCGSDSRWIYKVNGKIQQPVCNEYKVANGDIIQWIFVCN